MLLIDFPMCLLAGLTFARLHKDGELMDGVICGTLFLVVIIFLIFTVGQLFAITEPIKIAFGELKNLFEAKYMLVGLPFLIFDFGMCMLGGILGIIVGSMVRGSVTMIGKFVEWSKRKYAKKQKIAGFIIGGLVFLIAIPLLFASASSFIDTKLNLPKLISEPFNFIIATFFIIFGLLFSAWAGFAQFKIGKGTPVPAMPAQRLVTTGPYALCRNPMLLGTVIYYLGISLWLSSLSAMMLTGLFLLCSIAYIKLIEEKELEARFGREYEEYEKKVPFLIPRLR